MSYSVLAIIVAAIICLIIVHRRDEERLRRIRGGFFDKCVGLFDQANVRESNVRFPVLHGRYQGLDVRIEPFIDDMSMRKLPVLWLKLSLKAPVPYAGVLDILLRPRGTEFYSSAFDLDDELEASAGWPKDALLRSSDSRKAPALEVLNQHLHLLHDPKCKELVIAPGGVKLIYQAAQAERAEYSVLRHTKFTVSPLTSDMVSGLVDVLCSIYHSLVPLQEISQRKLGKI